MKILPSILAADYLRLGEQIAEAERGGADRFHIDVMDGLFVPNISLGIPVVEAMRRGTKLPPGDPPDDRAAGALHGRLRQGWR